MAPAAPTRCGPQRPRPVRPDPPRPELQSDGESAPPAVFVAPWASFVVFLYLFLFLGKLWPFA